MLRILSATLCAALLGLTSCGGDTSPAESTGTTSTTSSTTSTSSSGGSTSGTGSGGSSSSGMMISPPPEAAPGCNPVIGDDCLTPFPSSFFEKADASTATGLRIQLEGHVLPKTTPPLSPDRYNQKDGFSPATPFLVYFKEGVKESELPPLSALSSSVEASSPIQIIDFATHERVPAFAEVDKYGVRDGRRALIVRAMTRLHPGTRYVIALVGLHDQKGKPLGPAPFVALRDKTPLSKSLEPLAATYEDIFAALEKAGVKRSALSLAWDVTTASDETATSHLTAMRDTTLKMVDDGKVTYTIGSPPLEAPNTNVLREVDVTANVPSYLSDDSGHSFMNFGADGQPALKGTIPTPITIKIPQCAATATAPLPIVVFGHGLFQNAQQVLANPLLEQVGNQACIVFIGTDWIGLASEDLPVLANYLPADLNNVYLVTDRLQQSHVNAQVMTRLMLTTLKDDPALAVNGHPVTDGKQIYYFGISDGGIQGATFMALTPDVPKGVLNVPGCEWSLMIFRSTDFAPLAPIISLSLPDPLDEQTVIALSQSEWDYSDPATFAPHLLSDPLPGVAAKQILVQQSMGDAQVTNLATEVLARTMGLPGLDLEVPIFGITQKKAPLDSAYTQWDSHPSQLPPTSDNPLTNDNGAHDAVYQYLPAQAQILGFLMPNGKVDQTCNGPCSFQQN